MQQLDWGTSAEISLIERTWVQSMTMDGWPFTVMPVTTKDVTTLIWEQEDNITGLQGVRGLDGEPSRVLALGLNRYQVTPGYYGEFTSLTEAQLTEGRRPGSFGDVINIRDTVVDKQTQLLTRRVAMLKKMGSDLLVHGVFSNAHPVTQQIMHTDSYLQRTFVPTVLWSTPATSTPLADGRAVALLGRGFSANFGAAAKEYMNRSTLNLLLNNTNPNDLGGKKLDYGSNFLTLANVNSFNLTNDLPQIEIVDAPDGLYNDTILGPTLYIPTGYSVVVGPRTTGSMIADLCMTRNSVNADFGPGAYSRVIDTRPFRIPGAIEVHDGCNVAPRVLFPSSIVVKKVA